MKVGLKIGLPPRGLIQTDEVYKSQESLSQLEEKDEPNDN
jgi:hypothetical protein